MTPSPHPLPAIVETGNVAMPRNGVVRPSPSGPLSSVIVELAVPSATVRMRTAEPVHGRVVARAYRPEIQAPDETARHAAFREAVSAIRAILGRDPVALEASDAVVVDATAEEISRLKRSAHVRSVLPNQALVRSR
jgi:hypothetical protein